MADAALDLGHHGEGAWKIGIISDVEGHAAVKDCSGMIALHEGVYALCLESSAQQMSMAHVLGPQQFLHMATGPFGSIGPARHR
jgi:hypothetical protein